MTEKINLPVVDEVDKLSSSPPIHYYPLPHSDSLDANADTSALYVHVPFCTTKCHYCDFYSIAGHLDKIPKYLAAIQKDIDLQTRHFHTPAPETIFIGGGTPTLLPPSDLSSLFGMLLNSINSKNIKEFTTEANPNTFDAPRAAVLEKFGVNRISFGAQSFNPAELHVLQRDHDPKCVAPAVKTARNAGITNINIDLIFGVPGQTLSSLRDSLAQALDLEPKHLSCYSLVYEPNTPMTARLKNGQFRAIDESLELEMFGLVQETLAAAGLNRYEISNFARPGFECRHNLHYWHGDNYLAYGPAAAAHHSGFRWKNVPSLTRYIDALLSPDPRIPITQFEHLTGPARWGELAMLAMRLDEGLVVDNFIRRTGLNAKAILAGVIQKYDGLNLLECTENGLRLTPRAVNVSDTIIAEVLAAFDSVPAS